MLLCEVSVFIHGIQIVLVQFLFFKAALIILSKDILTQGIFHYIFIFNLMYLLLVMNDLMSTRLDLFGLIKFYFLVFLMQIVLELLDDLLVE